MLYQLGITTYRQIARWNERDIDEFDAKLPEFPGRIRRDAAGGEGGAVCKA